METLEIRSKDFLVKWVNAPDNSLIDWQVKPLKKSISLMIYKKDEENTAIESENDEIQFKPPSASFIDDESSSGTLNSQNSRNGSTRLRSNSILLVNQVTNSKNIYKTKSRSLLLENIHKDLNLLKDYSKLIPNELVHGKFTVTKGGMFAFIFDNSFSKTIAKKVLFSTKIILSELNKPSFDRRAISHIRNFSNLITSSSDNQNKDINSEKLTKNKGKDDLMRPKNGELLQSVLLKRRKKKLQGFTKRFFVLNFKYGTLSYFRVNDNKLRGQMPIKHSVISANSKNREIIIDSGMEVWDLKCLNDQNFKAWVEAFNDVKRYHFSTPGESLDISKDENNLTYTDFENILQKLEILQSSCMTDSRESISEQISHLSSDLKKLMGSSKNISRQSNVPDVLSMLSANNEFYDAKEYIDAMYSEVVILDKNKDMRENLLDGRAFPSDDSLEETSSNGMDTVDDVDDASEVSSNSSASVIEVTNEKLGNLVPHDDLYPLPHDSVKRESDIPAFDHPPPSLLGFIRKNIGKDLSTIAMPVDMNEPLTILQKYSEMFEYCDLINNALSSDISNSQEEKILRIATFATTYLSGMRSKLRNCRKPFTPLLGETFELVREDFGMRLLSEKICHRPAIYAMHAESKDWIFTFSPSPNQKIWGKNAEIVTKGTARLTDKSTGEVFSWQHPTTLLKNMIAGEKYSEPTTSMTVRSDNGYKAVVDFAKGGMFSGRSEDVTISAYSPQKELLKYSVTGKWTESMTLKTKTTEKLIWKVGELLPNPSKKFGFTEFAGTLNKITDLEKDKLPPNDSRLRPDMQYYIKGNIDEAEKLKNSLEQKQRERRNALEHSSETYKPLFFKEVDGESDTKEWVMIEGEKSYWNRRKNNDWSDIPKLW